MASNETLEFKVSADVKEAVAELESVKKQMKNTALIAEKFRAVLSKMKSYLGGNNSGIGNMTGALKTLDKTVSTLSKGFKNVGGEARSSFGQVRTDAQKTVKDVAQLQSSLDKLALPGKAAQVQVALPGKEDFKKLALIAGTVQEQLALPGKATWGSGLSESISEEVSSSLTKAVAKLKENFKKETVDVAWADGINQQMQETAVVVTTLDNTFHDLKKNLSENNSGISDISGTLKIIEKSADTLSGGFKNVGGAASDAFEKVRTNAQRAAKDVSQLKDSLSKIALPSASSLGKIALPSASTLNDIASAAKSAWASGSKAMDGINLSDLINEEINKAVKGSGSRARDGLNLSDLIKEEVNNAVKGSGSRARDGINLNDLINEEIRKNVKTDSKEYEVEAQSMTGTLIELRNVFYQASVNVQDMARSIAQLQGPLANLAVTAGAAQEKLASLAGASREQGALTAGDVLKQEALAAGNVLKQEALAAGNNLKQAALAAGDAWGRLALPANSVLNTQSIAGHEETAQKMQGTAMKAEVLSEALSDLKESLSENKGVIGKVTDKLKSFGNAISGFFKKKGSQNVVDDGAQAQSVSSNLAASSGAAFGQAALAVSSAFTQAALAVGAAWQQAALMAGSAWQQAALTAGPTWQQAALTAGSTWQQMALTAGATWQQMALAAGATWQQAALMAGATWQQIALPAGATWQQIALTAGESWQRIALTAGESWQRIALTAGESWQRIALTAGENWQQAALTAGNAWQQFALTAGRATERIALTAGRVSERLALPARATYDDTRMERNRAAWEDFTFNARKKFGGPKLKSRALDGVDLESLKAEAQRAGAEAGKAGGQAFSNNFAQNTSLQQAMAPITRGIRYLTMRFAIAGTAVGAAFVRNLMKTLNVGSGFEAQMTSVKVISGATAEEFDALTAKAREMGATLPITAQQAGAAMQVMAQRGTQVKDILTSVTDITNMAISQGIDMASAASLIGSTMTNFGIAVENAARVTDVFNNAANQSALSAATLQTSMNYIAPAAAAAGLSLESTVAAMEVLANAGLDASMVGTGLAMVVQKLSSANYVLGVSTKDAEGNMRPLEEIFKELQARGMTLAEATEIFGARASKAALNLTKYADTLGGLESNLRKTGSTSAAVEEKMKTFQNIWESFRSAAESVHINIFEQIKEQSKDAVSGLAEVTRGLSAWIERTDVAKKATDAFIEGLGLNVDFKGLLEGLDVSAVVDWFRKFGETIKDFFSGLSTVFNMVKGPLSLLISNLGLLIKGGFFVWVLNKGASLISMLGHIGNALDGVSGAAGLLSSNFTKGISMINSFTGAAKLGIGALGQAAVSLGALGVVGAFAYADYKIIEKYFNDMAKARRMSEDAVKSDDDANSMKNAATRLDKVKARYMDIADLISDLNKKEQEWLKGHAEKEKAKDLEHLKAAMKEYNESLPENMQFLKMDDEEFESAIDWMLKAAQGLEVPFGELSAKQWEVVERFKKIKEEAQSISEVQIDDISSEMKKGLDEAHEKLEKLKRESNVKLNFDFQLGERLEKELEKAQKRLKQSKELLGDANIEFAISANTKELEKELKEAAKDIAKSMKIPEDVVFQGLIKKIDDLNKEGKGTDFTKHFVREMGTAKQQLDSLITKAKDSVKYLGKAPESFLPALKKIMAGMDKTDILGNVTEEFKKIKDAVNELESSSLDKFMTKFKDSVEYLGKSPYKLIPQFEALASGIRKVDEVTGEFTDGYKKAVDMGREVTKVVIDKIASQSKDAIDFSFMSPEKLLPKFEALTQSINKINPVTKQVDEGFKKAYATMKEMANLTFDNLKSEIESLKKGVERGIVDKRVLDQAMKDAKKTIEVELYAQYEATRPEKEKAYKEKYRGDYRSVMQNELLDKVYQQYGVNFGEEAAKAFLEKYTKFGKNAGAYFERDARAQYERERKYETAKEKKAIEDATTAKAQQKQDKGQVTEQFKKASETAKDAVSVENILKEVATNFTTGATELKAAGEAQGKAATDFANNVTGVQTAVTTLVTRLAKMETTIQANTKALDDARAALNGGGTGIGAKDAQSNAESTAKGAQTQTAEQSGSLETLIKDNTQVLGELKGALEKIVSGKDETASEDTSKADVSGKDVEPKTSAEVEKLKILDSIVKEHSQNPDPEDLRKALLEFKESVDNEPKSETASTEPQQVDLSGVISELTQIKTEISGLNSTLTNLPSSSSSAPTEGATEPVQVDLSQVTGELSSIAESFRASAAALENVSTAIGNIPQGKAEPTSSENVDVGNITTELSRIESSIAASSQVFRDAASTLREVGNRESGGGTDMTGVQSALERMSGVLDRVDGTLGQNSQALDNAGRLADSLPQIEAAVSQNAQALDKAATAISSLASKSNASGGADTNAQTALNQAATNLNSAGSAISSSSTALTNAASALERASSANSGGDVHINLHDFTVKQESDIQRIKQMIQDALRSAGLIRPGLGLGMA